jgi:type VII secretion EsaA-like protein
VLKKILIGLATLGLAGLLIASSSSIGRPGAVVRPGAPTIALVNEDQPGSFNGTEYLFGKEFVGLVSNDNRYNWQVVSRGVAEKAYSDEAVSAVIVLPRSFTHDILTLQDIDPTRAVIDYRVAPGDQLSRQRLQNEVFTILHDFNTRVVEMYFASVAGNISNAQAGMESVVERYAKLVGTLGDDFQPQLTTAGEGHKRSESLAQILRSMNAAWIQAQNGFTTSTTGTLTSIGGWLAARQPELSDYFSLQDRIAKTNVLNGNTAIGDQATSDKDFYDQAFADHVRVLRSGDGTWSGLDGLSSTDADGAQTGALAQLQKTVAEYDALASAYNTDVAGVATSLRGQRDALDGSTTELIGLATRLFTEYFGSAPAIDSTNYTGIDPELLSTDGEARQALAEKVARTFAAGSSTASTLSTYEQEVATVVSRISTDPDAYTQLFDTLQSATDFDPAPYESRLELIKRYASANNIAGTALTVVPTARSATEQTVTKTLPVTVPAGQRDQVEVQLPKTLTASDVTVTVASPSVSEPGADRATVDQATDVVTIDNTQGSEPVTVVLAYAIDLHDLAGDTLLEYTATNTQAPATAPEVRSLGSDRYLLMPASAAAGAVTDGYRATTSYLADITTAANLLRFLYGAPGESEASFGAAVLADGQFRDHSADSVYKQYGVVDAATIEDRLDAQDVADYRTLGIDNIDAVLKQLGTVVTARAAIDQDITRLSQLDLKPSYFASALQQLDAWYAAARTSIDTAPELWAQKSNTVIQLTTVPWDGQAPGLSELYLDDKTGPALYKTLTQLVETSSRSAESVAASARLIDDNSAQFDDLIAGVQRTQAETNTLLGAMNGTIAADKDGVAKSSEFSSRFSTVLSNTRASGADPAKIYETFANPVTVKDTTPAAKADHGDGFDYRWIAIFVAGGLIGGLVAALVARRKRRPVRETNAGS